MSFWVQHGYGKSDKIDRLINLAAVDGVILGPASEPIATMRATVLDLARRGVPMLLDPQTHVHSVPNTLTSNHGDHGLDFGSISLGMDPLEIERQVAAVIEANDQLGLTDTIIAPTVLQRSFGDGWTTMALQYARAALRQARTSGRPVYATVAVEDQALGDWPAISRWLDQITGLDVDGFYVVVARSGDYPAPWRGDHLTNLMRLTYRLSGLNDYPVLLGYGDLDGLAVIAAGGMGVATGWTYGLRLFKVGNWLPINFARQPVPRVTSGPLLLPLRFAGEAQDVVAGPRGQIAYPSRTLRATIAAGGPWSRAQAQSQHMLTVSELARGLAALPADQRPSAFQAMTAVALTEIRAIHQGGASLAGTHAARLRALSTAADEFVRLENL